MKILGISAGFHDAAATVIHNGDILFAGHSERYSKQKNDANIHADLLKDALVHGVDHVAYYERPWLKQLRQWYAGQGIEWDKVTLNQVLQQQVPEAMQSAPSTSTVKYILDITNPVLSFIDQLPYPIEVQVANQTNTVDLYPGIDYEIDWVSQTVTMITGNNNDIITLTVYGLGGGNQLYRNTYIGNEIVGNEIIVPVAYNEIFEFAIFVNGQLISNYTFEQYQAAKTKIIFSSSYTNVD